MVTTAVRKQVDQVPTGATRGALVGRKPGGVGAAIGVGAESFGRAVGNCPQGRDAETAMDLAWAAHAATASAAAARRAKPASRIKVLRPMLYLHFKAPAVSTGGRRTTRCSGSRIRAQQAPRTVYGNADGPER